MKKKVSFDIEEEILEDIKIFCKTRNVTLSNFYRQAVVEYLQDDISNQFIFIVVNNKIKRFLIDINSYSIMYYKEINSNLKKMNVVSQGQIILKKNFGNNEELNKMLEKEKILEFFIV
jgi:hypothetical protein